MPPIDLTDLQRQVWQTAEDQGHHLNLSLLPLRLQTLVRLALAHTEVSEAQEVLMSCGAQVLSVQPHVVEELADTAIRLMELAWCCALPLTIQPCLRSYVPTDFLPQLSFLHVLIDRITQEVKRHDVTLAMCDPLVDALNCCWGMAFALDADLAEAIRLKDAHNRTRPYQYGTPTGVTP